MTCFPFPYLTGLSFPTLFVSKWVVVWAIYWIPLALEPRKGKLTSILVLWGSSHHSENGDLAVPAGFPKPFIAWITLLHCLWLTVCTSFSQCCVLVCGFRVFLKKKEYRLLKGMEYSQLMSWAMLRQVISASRNQDGNKAPKQRGAEGSELQGGEDRKTGMFAVINK